MSVMHILIICVYVYVYMYLVFLMDLYLYSHYKQIGMSVMHILIQGQFVYCPVPSFRTHSIQLTTKTIFLHLAYYK